MTEKINRIIRKYIAKTEDTEETTENEEDTNLNPEEKIKELQDQEKLIQLAKNSLKINYATAMNSFLKQLDIDHVLMATPYIVASFSKTSYPTKQLNSSLANLKNKIIFTLTDIALEDKNSLLDLIKNYIMTNKDLSQQDVESYTRELVMNIKEKTKQYLRRLGQLQ